jgi:tRNA(fMet)-specific endonuclease VapC
MKYLLDTNICIYLMKHQPQEVAERFATCYQGDVVISAITLAELEYGIACCTEETRVQNQQALDTLLELIPVLPFESQAARAYASVRYVTRDKKSDALDKLIAAQALAMNLIVVTNNESDFKHYPGIQVENWLKLLT